jgi:hypothetical protein
MDDGTPSGNTRMACSRSILSRRRAPRRSGAIRAKAAPPKAATPAQTDARHSPRLGQLYPWNADDLLPRPGWFGASLTLVDDPSPAVTQHTDRIRLSSALKVEERKPRCQRMTVSG